ncbi:rho guanine nucleotide exchange factor 11-like isoform X4 [Apostichopus japonicus]|uniref:rho guanine nucleotide exchange factor 11-like isoform X4 n=1 Tax=Stichopus japonicus TaxID=307972 RepID=UPI003AB6E6DB
MMEPEADSKDYAASDALMTQRCVIVQRDERGYGLTVSGDNPVRIQSVKPGGPASKGGVQEGDTIIKVNGTLVTSSNHAEVVKLIKAAGSFVALTLLGKQPHPVGTVPPMPYTHQQMEEKSRDITAPKPASDDTARQCSQTRLDTLKHMLEKEKGTFVEIQERYAENPTDQLKKELASTRNRMNLLEKQLQTSEATATIPIKKDPTADSVNDNILERRHMDWHQQQVSSKHTRQVSNPDAVIYSMIPPTEEEERVSSKVKRNRSDAQDSNRKSKGPRRDNAVKRRSHELQAAGRAHSVPVHSEDHEDDRDERRSRAVTLDPMQNFGNSTTDPKSMNLFNPVPSTAHNIFAPAPMGDHNQYLNSRQIIAMDDEFQSDPETYDEHGPFDSLEELEKKPAHLAVFLHYLISNSDPSSMFFYLVTEDYKAGSLKEMKKWSYEIFSSFIAENAPMRVEGITKATAENIEADMSASNLTDEKMKQLFVAAQSQAVQEVLDLLAEFRRNRSLGLGSIFGDQWVQESMERHQEIGIVEQLLMPHLTRIMNIKNPEDRNSALASALSTFLRRSGVKVQGNSSLERCPSFANKDKKTRGKPSKKKIQQSRGNKQHVNGHQFQETNYTSTAFCGVCKGLLWGIGNQGLRCQECELNIHKNDVCLGRADHCLGKPSRKSSRTSAIRGMIPAGPIKKKPQNKSKNDESMVTQPGAISPTIVERLEEEDDEIKHLQSSGRVNNIVSRFKNPENYSVSSQQTDSGVSTQSGDETSPNQHGEGGGSRVNLARASSLKARNETRTKVRVHDRRSKSGQNETDSIHSKDDVDVDPHSVMAVHTGHLSSQSSLSGKSQESISSISETRTYTDDSDMEAEQDTPNWQKRVDKDIVKKLKPKEVKKQEIINELFHTERTHVRNLKVLDKVFYQPMLQEAVLPRETVMYLFPNLPALVEEHGVLNTQMKKDKKTSHVIHNVGNLLLQRFDGEAGKAMKMVSAEFCINQRHGLEMIKSKQRKDPKLAAFISEQEANPLCRRLPLRGIISTQMQRLTKYPLFIGQLLKYSQPNTDDYAQLDRALQCCKDLLEYVNQAVREADNRQRLHEISKKMDATPYERVTKGNPDEVNTSQIFHKLLYDSPLIWKLSRSKSLEMHAMLLEEYVVLLQKQDEKFILKFHSTSSAVGPLQGETSVNNNKRNTHSPIITLSTTLCRQVATSKKAFFLICTSHQGPQIYELVAPSVNERKTWMDLIGSAQENINRRSSGKGTNRMNLPQRPDYHLNELDVEKNKDANVHPPAERAETTKVIVKTPEVVTRAAVPFNNTTPDEQGDATTLLKTALEENISNEADIRKTSQHIRLLLSRAQRVIKEKSSEPLVASTLERISEQFQRVQKLHEGEVRSLEYDLASEETAKVNQQKEVKRLKAMLYELQNTGESPPPTNYSREAIVTDLDHNDTDPESKTKKNRLSYSADSNSSATDESDGNDHHDYEDITEGRDPGDDRSNSGDSSENTLQPQVHSVRAQVAPEISNTQIYHVQNSSGDEDGDRLSATVNQEEQESRASCIQEESALVEELPTKMDSMHLADLPPDNIRQPENYYWALSESHTGEPEQFVSSEESTGFDKYEEVEPIVTPEPTATHQFENFATSGGFSCSTAESLSSYADDTSSSSAVDLGRSSQPEGGATLEEEGEEEGQRSKNSKHEESGSTTTTTTSSNSSSSGSRPASMVSADSGSEERGEQSAQEGKDSEDSDDHTMQVESTETLLQLEGEGDKESPTQDKDGDTKQLQPSTSSPSSSSSSYAMEDDNEDVGTDVDNPVHLQLIIEENLPEVSNTPAEETESVDVNLNATEEGGDAPTIKQEVLEVVEEEEEVEENEENEEQTKTEKEKVENEDEKFEPEEERKSLGEVVEENGSVEEKSEEEEEEEKEVHKENEVKNDEMSPILVDALQVTEGSNFESESEDDYEQIV